MVNLLKALSVGAPLPALCMVVVAAGALESHAQTSSQTAFPDVPANYWAQPYIQRLAERNIITGYPDGTFRPQESVDRDEFAAIIRKAFNQKPIRQIQSGAVYKDVPVGYWASRPIEEAYQQGFMTGYPGGYFRPKQPVSKVETITALTKGLNITGTSAQAPVTRRKTARKPIFVPIAITSLMQPILLPKAEAITPSPAVSTPSTTGNQAATLNGPASFIVTNTYADANKIPQYAVADVAAATQSNIIVNYPNPKILNPRQPASRAETAALIYQTLVAQGRAEPLANNLPATKYIVRTGNTN
ncbi:S-layer domain-containing protein [Calothrix sp. NIES-4071]|nr:S-layer domain-containing protein [Calothrix sp. NIES-4071]BAZ55177.1 S-layer domain-containing protein [Calothrix sp. NIES-4105]